MLPRPIAQPALISRKPKRLEKPSRPCPSTEEPVLSVVFWLAMQAAFLVVNENGYVERHNHSMIRVLQLEQGVNLSHSHPRASQRRAVLRSCVGQTADSFGGAHSDGHPSRAAPRSAEQTPRLRVRARPPKPSGIRHLSLKSNNAFPRGRQHTPPPEPQTQCGKHYQQATTSSHYQQPPLARR